MKTMSGAVLLESYKKRYNNRSVGVKEDQSSDDKISESYLQLTQNVLQVAEAEKLGANVASGHLNCPSSAKPHPEQGASN